ncbi:MAG: hypothetical protein NDJ89_08470 [Oligoflexia bacterium]|nr:hypothetical protein [Oligoflexia bacterium]
MGSVFKKNSALASFTTTAAGLAALTLSACGGGGGGGGNAIYYPYETLYGQTCTNFEPTPGCTFLRKNGERITVNEDPDYNDHGRGSDDMWYVSFDSTGMYADVYDEFGFYQYTASTSQFANYVGGSYIGLGTTGAYWEDITNGTYWLGKNGVLYSANTFDSNYGRAINDKAAGDAADTNFAALASEANDSLVKAGTEKLVNEYGFSRDKAVAVASALNRWGVAAAERGYTTSADMDATFKSVFGVNYSGALAAVKSLQDGDTGAMRELTQRSAAALGLKPHQAQKFMKGMYRKALANWGYDVDQLNW